MLLVVDDEFEQDGEVHAEEGEILVNTEGVDLVPMLVEDVQKILEPGNFIELLINAFENVCHFLTHRLLVGRLVGMPQHCRRHEHVTYCSIELPTAFAAAGKSLWCLHRQTRLCVRRAGGLPNLMPRLFIIDLLSQKVGSLTGTGGKLDIQGL